VLLLLPLPLPLPLLILKAEHEKEAHAEAVAQIIRRGQPDDARKRSHNFIFIKQHQNRQKTKDKRQINK
jgi:hypothetical protein